MKFRSSKIKIIERINFIYQMRVGVARYGFILLFTVALFITLRILSKAQQRGDQLEEVADDEVEAISTPPSLRLTKKIVKDEEAPKAIQDLEADTDSIIENRVTPISALKDQIKTWKSKRKQYEQLHGEKCEASYSFGLYDTWSDNSNQLNIFTDPNDQSKSRVECRTFSPFPDSHIFCISENILPLYNGQELSIQPTGGAAIFKQVTLFGDDEGLLKPTTHFKRDSFFYRKAQLIVQPNDRFKSMCKRVITHPVFFVHRYDPTNVFHANEDFIMVFLTLALILDDPFLSLPNGIEEFDSKKQVLRDKIVNEGLEIVLIEPAMIKGFYMKFWERLSEGLKRKGLRNFKVRILKTDPFEPDTCFSFSIQNVDAGASPLSSFPLTKEIRDCRSSMLMLYQSWIRDLFSIFTNHPAPIYQPLTLYPMTSEDLTFQFQGKAQVREVIYTTRFVYEHLRNLDGWHTSRILINENELILALQKSILDRNQNSCIVKQKISQEEPADPSVCPPPAIYYAFRAVDFSVMNFLDQFHITSRASALIGVHGAALAHNIFMDPANSGLIEISPAPQQVSFHYQHISVLTGQFYAKINAFETNMAPIGEVVTALNKLLDHLENTAT